jgi:pyruvate dehydrogenase E2 component (dihydrolipoamide acetyltransferase)
MARFEFKLPDIGEGVTEGEIVSWLVKVGDTVSENQDMVEVMTDKATVTIGAPRSGTIAEVRGKEGDVVPVGQVLVVLDLEGAAPEPAGKAREAREQKPEPERQRQQPAPAVASPAKAAAPPVSRVAETTPASAEELESEEEEAPAATAVGDIKDVLPGMAIARPQKPAISELYGDGNGSYTNENPLAAPATRKLARELGIDLRRVRPTGPAGRVTREDVERYRGGEAKTHGRAPAAAAIRTAPSAAEPAAPAPRAPAAITPEPRAADERMPIRGLRKRIFENMARSKHTAAHFTYVDECDAGALRALRERMKPHAEAASVKLSFLPFVVKAVVAALKRHPTLNAVMDDAAHELVLRKSYDIGIATATEAGLMVPVVRSAERRSLLELGAEIERLAEAARAGKSKKEDLGGSSFTITSLGKLGGLFATPVVNYPEVAILGVHEIKQRAVVKNDQIAIGEVMLLSLSFDHRIIDGHVGAAFARDVIGYLEDPDRLFLELA